MSILKDLRVGTKETQQQIADLLGITRGAYTNIENGKRGCDSDASELRILGKAVYFVSAVK